MDTTKGGVSDGSCNARIGKVFQGGIEGNKIHDFIMVQVFLGEDSSANIINMKGDIYTNNLFDILQYSRVMAVAEIITS